jgi:hypothetical protein
MPVTAKELYKSSNGDRWILIQEPESKGMAVRHEPNRASGGKSSVLNLEAFLSEGHGPQHEALLCLLEDTESTDADPPSAAR